MNFQDAIEKAVHDIKTNHDKIIDDWCKAYMAQRYKEGMSIDVGSFTLCQQNLSWAQNEVGFKYWFEDGKPRYPESHWIDARKEPPRKDIPILVITEFCEMPDVVRWLEDGTYGEPGFFESNDEYETKEKDILYWMPAPEVP